MKKITTFSKQELFDDFQQIYEKHNTINKTLYNKKGKYKLSTKIIFGDLIREYNQYISIKNNLSSKKTTFTKDDLVSELKNVYTIFKESHQNINFTQKYFLTHSKLSISPNHIRQYFNSFPQMLQECNICCHHSIYTKEYVLNRAWELYKQHGKLTTNSTFKRSQASAICR